MHKAWNIGFHQADVASMDRYFSFRRAVVALRISYGKTSRAAARLSRLAINVAVTGLFVLVSAPAFAQSDYPSRPVRIVVGVGAGSSGDVGTRVLAQKLSQILGQQFIVENKPGAGTSLAAEFVARAPKDGYTLFLGSVANTINSTLSPHLSFDFAKDFTPVTLFAVVPNVLVVHPSVGVSNVTELIAAAKSKPGQIMYGSSGVGTSPHLSGELFNYQAGVKLTHVPYSGSAQAVTDLIAGRISVMFSPASSVAAYVEAGKLKALAVSTSQRTAIMPTLPTIAESGLPGFDTAVWLGIVAPAGTPQSVINRLAQAIAQATKSEDMISPLRKLGFDVMSRGPEEFDHYIASETKKWAEVVKRAGLIK